MRVPILLFTLLLNLPLSAQPLITDVIQLQARDSSELISTLKPLLPPPAAVSGLHDQLVVRGTAYQIQTVRNLLKELDRPPRRLMISVRREHSANLQRYRAGLQGRIGNEQHELRLGGPTRSRKPGARVHITGRQAGSRSDSEQRLQVLEGSPAFIRMGQEIPVPERQLFISGRRATVQESIRYQDATTGFSVLPRLNGQQVTLRIAPRSARPDRHGGGLLQVEEAVTEVSGQLGEWLLIGARQQNQRGDGKGLIYGTRGRDQDDRVILIKVDEIPPP